MSLEIDTSRLRYGLAVILIGMVLVLAVFLVSIGRWADVKDVTAVVGTFTSFVGTLVGTFFGLNVGASGKEKVENQREQLQKQLNTALAALAPAEAIKIAQM